MKEAKNEINNTPEITVEGLATISKEVKKSMVTVTRNEARFLVDTYYQVQHQRMVADNQIRAIIQGTDDQNSEIPLALQWVSSNMRNQEKQIKKMLDAYTSSVPVGRWCKSIIGVGPVLAAGCLSYFDINKAPHYNHFWSFCGLNDYNNPWLGKEKANKIVKEIYEYLEDRDKKISKFLGIDLDDKQIKKKFGKYSKKNLFGAGCIIQQVKEDLDISIDNISNECLKSIKDNEKFNEIIVDADDDIIEDFFIRNFVSRNAVTETVIVELMKRVKRTHKVIINGLNNVCANTKKKDSIIQYTKSDLVSYLSKPPYNRQAKQLVYLLGESFIKVSSKEESLYGRLYRERKAYELVENEKGKYADLAAEALSSKNYGKDTISYKAYIEGKLPSCQIHARARRHAVMIFLSHLYEAMYMEKYHCAMPEIYPIAHLGHLDYIGPECPFSDFIDI